MNKFCFAIYFCFLTILSYSQSDQKSVEFNFGFEKLTVDEKMPDNWFQWGSGYNLVIDTITKRTGKQALLIEPQGKKSADAFGCVAYSIPPIYEGKEIELKAYMKLKDVSNGSVGLLLRIDGDSGPLGFENMADKNIQGTSDWVSYSVKLPLPENAKKIFVGALLSGTGQLWVDDFEVLIDGKDITKAKTKTIVEYKADQDKEFDKGSAITADNLASFKTEDLVLLGQLWGYLKYYHPLIAKGEYNWDYELFRILPKLMGAKDNTERNSRLMTWVVSLGKVKPEVKQKTKVENIKIQPDLAWINATNLGNELAEQLLNIKDVKRTETNYYIGLAPGVGNPEFKNEKAYSKMAYPDAGFRLLSLYRYWNMIHYYFPYKNLLDDNWNNVLKEFIPKCINSKNELEYKLTTLALIANVHDTHANIWGQDPILKQYKGLNYAPLEITFIESKAVVTDYYNKDLGLVSGVKIGDVIESINGKSVDEIIKEKLPLTPASNYPTQLRDIAKDLLRTNDAEINITYSHDDKVLSTKLATTGADKLNLYKNYEKRDTCFKMITPDIAYFYQADVKTDYLKTIMPQVLKSKGLIIDFRCYPSDFTVFSLSQYLLPEKTSFVKFSNGSVISPGLFTIREGDMIGSKSKNYFKGKVVIIVNENTQSSAEYHTMAFRTAPQATVIGSTTAAADGNVSSIILPGGISTMISGIGVYYPDGKETQRVGIAPSIEVKPTIKGIKEGRDELIEKAIEIINGK